MMSEAIARRLHLVIPEANPVSYNGLLRRHYRVVTEAIDAVRVEIMVCLHELAVYPEPFSRPVHITITSYKPPQPLDADNVPAKLYVDALRAAGVLVNDNPKYVDGVTTYGRVDRDYPRIEITIEEVA